MSAPNSETPLLSNGGHNSTICHQQGNVWLGPDVHACFIQNIQFLHQLQHFKVDFSRSKTKAVFFPVASLTLPEASAY